MSFPVQFIFSLAWRLTIASFLMDILTHVYVKLILTLLE